MMSHHYPPHDIIAPDFRDSPPPLPQRKWISPQSNGGIIANSPQVPPVAPANPVVMPVFPLHPTLSKYSPYSATRFHIDKRCEHRCTWKGLSIGLIFVCLILGGLLAYFAALASISSATDCANCIVVEDAKVLAQNDEPKNPTLSQAPTEESSPTSTVDSSNPTLHQGSLPNKQENFESDLQQQHQQQQQLQETAVVPLTRLRGPEWPAVVEMKEFGVTYRTTIESGKFWYSEFRNKESGFVRFNLTLGWSSNFAIYGRRNVAPTITQYDFVEFIKGGKLENRSKRSILMSDYYFFGNSSDDSYQSQPHSPPAVSFTTSTTRKWRDRKFIPHENILQVPPPHFIVRNNRLESFDKEESNNTVLPTKFDFKKIKSANSNTKTESKHLKKDLSSVSSPTVGKHANKMHKLFKRSTDSEFPGMLTSFNVSIVKYLDTGRWYLSIFNDNLKPQNVSLIISEAEDVSTACPNDCSGHGSCYLGKCDCIDGYEGLDCSKSVCPVLCSNHGKYGGGLCHCEEGWKGIECDVPEHDCHVPDCSGNGECLGGVCACKPGWKGLSCDELDCLDPKCSGHGSCVMGKCYCKPGWEGANCSEVDQQIFKCLPSCSDHGIYDLDKGSCVCDNHWTGPDCSQVVCNLDCGTHGICKNGKCECDVGWTGDRCDLLPCDDRCSEHGQCKNGTCVCSQGWNGRHCTLPGCRSSCNHHGTCTLEDGEYHCVCSDGWAGIDCGVRLEMECSDDIDNDEDGMTDCSDSECCSHPSCSDHIMCLASNDPVEVLLRKQPPSVTASFYQRVKFLIEENSVQSYAHPDEYSESRVAVMRGQIITPQGLGIVGVRVSVDRDSRFGFTLTRSGGWFDVLVNGGGAVTLQFQRSPFRPTTRTVFVPWNQIVVLAPVVMQLNSDTRVYEEMFSPVSGLPISMLGGVIPFAGGSSREPCMEHDHETLRPVILSTWMHEKVGGISGRSVVFAESQILQESIQIPGSGLYLMHQSSQAPGYLSTVLMRLTHSTIPNTLTHVHVRVEIEGAVYTKTYEADPNLTHKFAWNKRTVYKQKVYGVAQAKISVGYEYVTCPAVVWETETAILKGFDVDISDVGGWNLDIHHHFNFHEGILQKGDGTTMHFKEFPRIVKTIMGTGSQRTLDCPNCNGPAKDSRLLSPVALTSGPDGSVYVGDFNMVRRIMPDGNVYTVLQLRPTRVSYQYYITVSPADGHLFLSDPEKHQVLRTLSIDIVEEPAINFEAVVGSGERCIPGDDTDCGDEGLARDAKLVHPKGLAIAADKTMYIADGTNIRVVDHNGIIHTIVGHHAHHTPWIPIPCRGSVVAQQVELQWPTGLALSPLDGSLHFIDDHLVLKLTDDLQVQVVAGIPSHCRTGATDHPFYLRAQAAAENGSSNLFAQYQVRLEEPSKATGTVLGSLLALAFSPNGDLFISEMDSRKVSSIYVVSSGGKISKFAGKQQNYIEKTRPCDCYNGSSATTVETVSSYECQCDTLPDETNTGYSSKETILSSNIQFSTVSALTVSPDAIINVADQRNLRILALEHYLPSHDENGEYKIPYPPRSEIYVFNKYGQHTETRDLTSGKTKHSFLYSKNTSFGKLSTVTDGSGNKILFLRDYSNVVGTIENTQNHKCDLKMSGVGLLVKFSEKGRTDIELEYDTNSGLLISRADLHGGGGGETYIYNYGECGRLTDVVLPTGEILDFESKINRNDRLAIQVLAPVQSMSVSSKNSQQQPVIMEMEDKDRNRLIVKEDISTCEVVSFYNNSYYIRSPWGAQFQGLSITQHPLLQLSLPVEAEMLPMWSKQHLAMGDRLVNSQQWTYNLVGDIRMKEQTLLRELWVNHSRVLGIEYNQVKDKETFYDRDKNPLIVVTYDHGGLPKDWIPVGESVPVNISYDLFKRVDGWMWGIHSEKYMYENHGLLSGISNPLNATTHFSYNEHHMLSQIMLPSQRKFTFQYDEDGGLRHVTLPTGTRHSFSRQPSIGFIRVTYSPPGSAKPYIQHYSHSGMLLQTIFPNDGGRVLYRYHSTGQLAEVLHGDARIQISYSPITKLPTEILHYEKDFDYRWDYQYSSGLLTEERLHFGAKTGLSNAKFTYEYDSNFRLIAVQGRIGGQTLPDHNLSYNIKTGAAEEVGQFKITRSKNETSISDGTAIFSRITNAYYQVIKVSVTIHRMEVFRMEFTYDSQGRISQTRTNTRNVGVNTYTNVKNYTWDLDGQLIGVEAQEPWGFKYDSNGNMLSLTYRGNAIPMEYNAMDRIMKFGEGLYHYDNRGLVAQNAREERFHYNAKGLLVRATKRGRFDVHYFYDHMDRLSTRRDNYGNVTQFFYTNHKRPNEVSHIYAPREGKLMSFTYDDRGHLIYAQVYRHKYYITTDQCGTPIMVFNQYGEAVREIMRSPYGHIVYDSNPYLYLPVDFCGGLLDQVTSLVHMPNGKVYDPLIGQWMTPMWEGVLSRISNPIHLHLYRFNGNDPVHLRRTTQHLTDYESWLSLLGYNLGSLAPQLYSDMIPGGAVSTSLKLGKLFKSYLSHPSKNTISPSMPDIVHSRSPIQSYDSPVTKPFGAVSGLYTRLMERQMGDISQLSSPPQSVIKGDVWPPRDFPTKNPASEFSLDKLGAASDPPFGKGILVTRTLEGRAIVRSVPAANPIYRDVFTSVFNQTSLLPFTFLHNGHQDVFYFVKEDTWRASEDKGQLKRLGGQINTTFHEKDVASSENSGGGKAADIRIHGVNAIINLRYGTTPDKEKQRLLHHAKSIAVRKAWHKEKEAVKNGFTTSVDWSTSEIDEIVKNGLATNYEAEYVHDVELYPELAEDPFNIKFVKKSSSNSSKRRRERRSTGEEVEVENSPYPGWKFFFRFL